MLLLASFHFHALSLYKPPITVRGLPVDVLREMTTTTVNGSKMYRIGILPFTPSPPLTIYEQCVCVSSYKSCPFFREKCCSYQKFCPTSSAVSDRDSYFPSGFV